MGCPDLASDSRYATNTARGERGAEVIGLVGDWTRAHTKAEVASKLGGTVPVRSGE